MGGGVDGMVVVNLPADRKGGREEGRGGGGWGGCRPYTRFHDVPITAVGCSLSFLFLHTEQDLQSQFIPVIFVNLSIGKERIPVVEIPSAWSTLSASSA
jgi:hypothetical protein